MGLERFIYAQTPEYATVLAELQAGRKRSHWMWFVFPQIRGLGRSATSQKFAIVDQEEAEQYLRHAVLGRNLIECTQIVVSHWHSNTKIYQIFNELDLLKFHACMTLFARISSDSPVFRQALDAFFDGREHRQTINLLEA